MEFWGVEVKAGAPVKVNVNANKPIHLSQASLGEVKKEKGSDSVALFLNVDGQKLVMGTLSAGKIPQVSYDLVMNKNFELSHNWKNGSIYFCGYTSELHPSDDHNNDSDSDSDSDFGADLPVMKDNGEPEPKDDNVNLPSKKSDAAKSKVKIAEPNKDDDSDEDSEDDSDDDESEKVPMDASGEDSSDEEGESSDEEDKDTPKKSLLGKKRPAESSSKAAVSEKKAKLVTPQKTSSDSKKSGVVHVATPYPSKKAGKTPANDDKSKQQTQKSGGQVACKSCKKTFNSDKALESHTKAKHADGK